MSVMYAELERCYRQGLATMPVCRINHCEFVMDGTRYFCGWSSEGTRKYSSEYGRVVADVVGWIVYKTEQERD